MTLGLKEVDFTAGDLGVMDVREPGFSSKILKEPYYLGQFDS